MRWVWPLIFTCPVYANLFFYLPNTQRLESGDLRLDVGATYGEYIRIVRFENRTYLPDLRLHAQLSPRIAFAAEVFGVGRSEDEYLEGFELRDSEYGPGDFTLGTWFDLKRKKTGLTSVKAFVMTKVPSADNEKLLGSDQADVYLGVSARYEGKRWSADGVLRLDIVGRSGDFSDQWDYATLALRTSYQLTSWLDVMAEGWRRHRDLNTTSLFSAGFTANLSGTLSLELLVGDGEYHHYETNPDSRLLRQSSLRFKWRMHSDRLTRFFSGE